MTDIFFSYSSADRERVRPIRDALVAQGFEVFWDQQVPAGTDWDTWIRQHLTKSKCAMAFWSATSVSSDNVRHEAMVAKQQGKLISVLLEPLTAEQFPMGLYAQQAANLSNWSGDHSHDEWRKFRREFEAKLTPLWVRRQIDEIEAELVGERTRREGAERRDRTMQGQIAKEVEVQQILKRERDVAFDEVEALKGTVEKLTQARADATAKQADAQKALKLERDSALDEVAALKATVEELTQAREHADARVVELSQHLRKVRQSKVQETARSIGAALSPFVIAAAVATLGFWTYQLIWSAPQPPAVASDSRPDLEAKLNAAEAEQQRLKDETQRQTKAVADADSNLKASQTEQQRLKEQVQLQTKATADLEAKLKTAEAEQQRLKAAAADADGRRKAAEAEQQRLKEEIQRQAKTAPAALPTNQPPPIGTTRLFTIKSNSEASGCSGGWNAVMPRSDCERACANSDKCQIFSYNNRAGRCYICFGNATFVSNENFDSGIRDSAALPANQPAPTSPTGLFTIRSNTEASGDHEQPADYSRSVSSINACEESCAQRTSRCKIFSYDKNTGICYRYSRADFKPNERYDSGIRK